MLRDLYEISRKLDLIMERLGIDPALVYPKGQFGIFYRDVRLFASRDYWECLDYLERCGGGFRHPLLIKRIDDEPIEASDAPDKFGLRKI